MIVNRPVTNSAQVGRPLLSIRANWTGSCPFKAMCRMTRDAIYRGSNPPNPIPISMIAFRISGITLIPASLRAMTRGEE